MHYMSHLHHVYIFCVNKCAARLKNEKSLLGTWNCGRGSVVVCWSYFFKLIMLPVVVRCTLQWNTPWLKRLVISVCHTHFLFAPWAFLSSASSVLHVIDYTVPGRVFRARGDKEILLLFTSDL